MNKIKSMNTKTAGGVVTNPRGKILVVNQKGTSWSLPKGHIEKDESELQAAKREIAEESGIMRLEFVKKLGTYQRYKISKNGGDEESELKTITMFLFKTKGNLLKPIDPENPEAQWVAKEEVADLLTHQKDKEFFLSIIGEL
jgi:ADP-ribose pyrophosphatase YjhB (NUDIX family)